MMSTFFGVIGGFAFGMFMAHVRNKNKPSAAAPASHGLICGACRSPIDGDPHYAVVSENGSFNYYRCPQCGTGVTTPI